MNPEPVPSLDELAAHPVQAAGLSPEVARALWARCCQLQMALVPALLAGAGDGPVAATGEDRLLDVAEAAKRLGVSKDWLYRRARRLPFTVRLGRALRFSAQGVERYMRETHP